MIFLVINNKLTGKVRFYKVEDTEALAAQLGLQNVLDPQIAPETFAQEAAKLLNCDDIEVYSVEIDDEDVDDVDPFNTYKILRSTHRKEIQNAHLPVT